MPDEVNNETDPAEAATIVSSGQSDTTPKPTGVVVDGETFDEKRIRELKEVGKEFQRDYTRKTTDLSAQRKELDRERAAIIAEKERISELHGAFAKDIEFFNTHSQDQWDGYQPQSVEIAKELGITPKSSPEAKILLDRIDALSQKVDFLSNTKTSLSVEEQVDVTLSSATELIEKTYVLADDEEVLAQIRLFHADNERLPNKKELTSIVSKSHNKSVSRGVQMPKEPTTEATRVVKSSSGSPPAPLPAVIPDINDRAAIRRASDQWFESRKARSA